MSEDSARFMRSRWGTDEQYYKELHKFYTEHRGKAHYIEYSKEDNCPIRAVYEFLPYQVTQEHFRLLERLKEACEESDKQREKAEHEKERAGEDGDRLVLSEYEQD